MRSPLHVVYSALVSDTENNQVLAALKHDFEFSFDFPTQKISSLPPLNFSGSVEWDEVEQTLKTIIVLDDVVLPCGEKIEHLFDLLKTEIAPFLVADIKGGYLVPLQSPSRPDDLAPGYQFTIPCHQFEQELLQRMFCTLVFDQAAFALFLTRSIYSYISAVGDLPSATERHRQLWLRYGIFQVYLKEEGLHSLQLPEGMYRNLYAPPTTRPQ